MHDESEGHAPNREERNHSRMVTLTHVLVSLLLGIAGGIPAGLLTNIIWDKLKRRRPAQRTPSTVVVVQSVTTHHHHYREGQPAVSQPSQGNGILPLLILVGGVAVIDRWYAKHEQFVTTITLVAMGFVIGMLLVTAWTFYAQPWLRGKLAWMLGGCVATAYLLWDFLFKRMPPAYYVQLHDLRRSPHVSLAHLHADVLVAYPLLGWGITILNIGSLFIALTSLLIIAHGRGDRPISRRLWEITEPRTGGLFLLISTALGYFLISGWAYKLL